MANTEWQWKNEYYDQGRLDRHYKTSGLPPYTIGDDADEREMEQHRYRLLEWLAGWHHQDEEESKK